MDVGFEKNFTDVGLLYNNMIYKYFIQTKLLVEESCFHCIYMLYILFFLLS